MPYDQNGRFIKINTILDDDPDEKKLSAAQGGGDPLLLFSVQGEEAISQPYSYTVTLLRDQDRHDLTDDKIKKLIGSVARISIRLDVVISGDAEEDLQFRRTGIIESFWRCGTQKKGTVSNDFYIYKATIVPPFKFLEHEVIYRIFENKDAKTIISEILTAVPHLKLSTALLHDEKFTPLEYCVQFGESTYQFLSRLMAYHGIWYLFDLGHTDDTAENETMFLGRSIAPKRSVLEDNLRLTSDDPALAQISDLIVMYDPMARNVGVGNFNPLKPNDPDRAQEKVEPGRDLVGATGATSDSDPTAFFTDTFPRSFLEKQDATDDAKLRMKIEESAAITAAGASKNTTFFTGRRFTIKEDKTERGQEGKTYIITQLSFRASDAQYLHGFGADFIAGGAALVKMFTDLFTSRDAADAYANAGINNAVKNSTQFAISSSANTGSPVISTTQRPLTAWADSGYIVAGMVAYLGGTAAAATVNFFSDLWKRYNSGGHFGEYGNRFFAMPADTPQLPLPTISPRPTARGPHLAVVIGPEGLDTVKANKEQHTDAFGRVRIRFPWDPGPPSDPKQQEADRGTGFYPKTTDPWKSDKNTCWVRVAQDWAGHSFGAQFIPRIGDEVIVDFIDGDPNRPIVTGRVYNADTGPANWPFLADDVSPMIDQNFLHNPRLGHFRYNGIKTRSILSKDKNGPLPDRFHLLRFDDTRDKEQYLIRSQRQLDITALEKRYESTGSDRHLTVGGKKLTPPPPEIGGDYLAHVFRHYHLHVGDPDFPATSGNRITLIEQNDETKVVKDSGQSIGGNWSVDVGGQATINAMGPAGTIVLNAGLNITLMVGASSIVITPAGISITAPVINLVAPAILSTVPVVPMGAAPLPPGVPIPPEVQKPTDPTPADPGDTLTPPE